MQFPRYIEKSKIYQRTVFKTAKLTEYIESGKGAILLKFPFDNETLNFVRSIKDRQYNKEKNYWTCPLLKETIEKLKSFGFKLDEQLEDYIYKPINLYPDIKQIEIPGLKGILRPFQNIGVAITDKLNGNALIADEQGLGKTVESLSYLQLHPEHRPVIIVAPSCVKLKWAKEAHDWLVRAKVQILSGETQAKIYGEIVIINYDILQYWVKSLQNLNAKVLICDECHFLKNNLAKRTKSLNKIARGIPHIIGLTGTPIENRPIEIYNIWHLIDPIGCPDYFDFGLKFCDGKFKNNKWDFSGSSNEKELHNKLVSSIMIRRLKKDVLPELPDKIYSHEPIELSNLEEYNFAHEDFIRCVTGQEKTSIKKIYSKIENLKQLAVMGKLKQSFDWIDNFIETDEKLVIYAHHKFLVDELMKRYKNIARKIDGSVSAIKREEASEEFYNNPKIKLFIISEAGGVGINLTIASHVAILELPWNKSVLEQIIDRLHRFGQLKCVNIYYLLAAGTIEEKIANIIDRKYRMTSAIIDGKDVTSEDLLTELIKQY
jgi:SWI/SNF-related matrix-associated actin-dependent regulator 1 of chromatin subfamily A